MTAPDKKTDGKRVVGDGTPGPGRPKGQPNKTTKQIKQMVAEALTRAGGIDYLVEQADKNPKAFLSLVGKIIPLQVNADHAVTVIDHAAAKAEVIEIFGPPRLVASNG